MDRLSRQHLNCWISVDDNVSSLLGTDVKTEKGYFGHSSFSSDLVENITQEELIYPEICMLELHLLSVGNPSLDVLIHVFHNFLKIVRLKGKNATLLMQQVNNIMPMTK